MTLEEMGALLRQERERQGIPLEKAAADIKISKKYLIALEAGQTGELPHPVYAKGFVKNYARLLGLDPEEMGQVLANHYAVDDDHLRDLPRYEGQDSGQSIKERRSTLASQAGKGGLRGALLVAVPVVLVLGGLAWFIFFSGLGQWLSPQAIMDFVKTKLETQAPAPEAPKPAMPAAKPESPPQSAAPKAEVKPEQQTPAAPAPAVSGPAAEQAAPVQRDLLATGSGPAQPTAPAQPQAEPVITPEKLASEAQFAATGKQVVEINANQPATLDVSTEDGRRRAFTLVKGQRLALRFNEKVVVRFQQAPAVSVKLNGKDYLLEGGKADGKSITFP